MERQRPAPWYKEFFNDDYQRIYRDRLAPATSEREAAFIVDALALTPGDRVLDLPCGHGRHAVPLAKRGMVVTGQDINPAYLRQAREEARRQRVAITTALGDMREIAFTNEFDAVINMFTAFGYFDSEDEDVRMLRSIHNALRPGGRLLLDTINREWVLANYVQNEWRSDSEGYLYLERRRFDLATGRNRVRFSVITPDGARRDSPGHDIRLYTLVELRRLLRIAGFRLLQTLGDYDSSDYAIASRRMIALAAKDDAPPHTPALSA